MNRRDFIKLLGMAGLTAMAPWPRSIARAQSAPYAGPLFISIAADGAWDVTSFCDPKENVSGEREINHWSRNASTLSVAGTGINYAPFSINDEFFERFGPHMLVINGVDAQTNSHDVGVRNNWSGRIPHGYPTFAAVAATALGADLPLAYLSSGGYRETAGLTPYTVVQDTRSLRDLVNPNLVTWGDVTFHDQDDLDIVANFQDDRLAALRARPELLPRTARGLDSMLSARANRDQLAALTALLPEEPVDPTDKNGYWNPLLRQAEIALIAYSAGLTVAADLVTHGFDTHQNHDVDQAGALTVLTNGINFLFDRAEQMGIADRVIVLISSDFGRTPHYNDDAGKDHWPIGSSIFIQQNAAWGGRTVGQTDERHQARPINPSTLAVDPTSAGVYIQPRHIHEAYRRLAGVESHTAASSFDLEAESIDFFNPALST